MKLIKALKVKNRLVGEVNTLQEVLARENARRSDNVSQVDCAEIYKQWGEKSAELVKIKSAIAQANIGIYAKIAEMAERKNHIIQLQALYTKEGPEVVRHNLNESDTFQWVSFINNEKRDQLIKEAQDKINVLQDEIDEFNGTTNVEL